MKLFLTAISILTLLVFQPVYGEQEVQSLDQSSVIFGLESRATSGSNSQLSDTITNQRTDDQIREEARRIMGGTPAAETQHNPKSTTER